MLCTVKMVQAQLPIADFAANVTAGCPPLIVSFTNLTSDTVDSVFSDFGNGVILPIKGNVTLQR